MAVEPRVNERIRSPEVRLVGPDGQQIGIISLPDAMKIARELDLDLVEVAPQARPPVCRLLDYGKYKYEQALKAKEAKKKQSQVVVKEMKMRPKIDPHDYATKKGHIVRFLNQGHKVKLTIMFRGREMAHTELGERILRRLTADLQELANVETPSKLDGRNMTMVFAPLKKKVQPKAEVPAGLVEEIAVDEIAVEQDAPETAAAEPASE
ncbi:MAG TPA: translation initiation factor IF-3 [Actinomycetota bacterium]|nr:translation initiation factor IF-3 [Actinomycetota bacterium]